MLLHKSTSDVAKFCSSVGFARSYLELKQQVEQISNDKSLGTDFHGDFGEVFVECFVHYFGENPFFVSCNDNHMIREIEDTSRLDCASDGRSMYEGIDFYAKNECNDLLALQVKSWLHKNSNDQISDKELGTFYKQCFKKRISPENAFLIVPFVPVNNENLFHYNVDRSCFNVIGREVFEACLDRDVEFWNFWENELKLSLSPKQRTQLKLWKYQQFAYDKIIETSNHCCVIMPTGGGKTALIAALMTRCELKIQVMVSPYIVLVRQNDKSFGDFGVYDKEDVRNMHIRTGQSSDECDMQTTNEENIESELQSYLTTGKQIIVNATYKSLSRLLNVLKKLGIKADRIYCDECHFLCTPDTLQQKQYISEIRDVCHQMMSFSARQKFGRFVRASDLGTVISETTYHQLQQKGSGDGDDPALVGANGKIHLCVIRRDGKVRSISFDTRYEASKQRVDIVSANCSLAAIRAFTQHVKSRTDGYVKMIVAETSCRQIESIENDPEMISFSKNSNVEVNSIYSGRKDCANQIKLFKLASNAILLQYIMACTGFDCKNVNSLLFNRSVNDEIRVQQFVGRTLRFCKGKSEAFIGISQLDDTDEEFADFFKNVYNTLIACGIPKKCIVLDKVDTRMSVKSPEDGLTSPIEQNVDLEAVIHQDLVDKTKIDYEHIMDCTDSENLYEKCYDELRDLNGLTLLDA